MTDLTAVVVSFDSAQALPACLEALDREEVPATVVDNASADGSAALAEVRGASVIRNMRNEGFGRAANIGVRAAATELVLILNPDVVLEAGAGAALVEAAGRYPDAGLFAPCLVEASGRLFFQPRSFLAPYLQNPRGKPSLPEADCCTPFLSGACLVVRRELFLSLGGFDEEIFLFYEDDDLCRRVAEAGHALVHVHGAVARHARGRSSAERRGRVFDTRWHQARSKAYVAQKYGLPDPAPALIAVNAPKAMLALLSLNPRLMERYAGSVAGALAAKRGVRALEREGLAPADTRP